MGERQAGLAVKKTRGATAVGTAGGPEKCRSVMEEFRPFAGNRLRLRGVGAHRQIERRLRTRKPVGLLVRPRTFVLKIKVERPVRVILQRHPAADSEPIERVRDL